MLKKFSVKPLRLRARCRHGHIAAKPHPGWDEERRTATGQHGWSTMCPKLLHALAWGYMERGNTKPGFPMLSSSSLCKFSCLKCLCAHAVLDGLAPRVQFGCAQRPRLN